MTKKLLSIALALALCLSLAVPALAAEGQIEAPETVTLTNIISQDAPVLTAGGWWVKRITCSSGAKVSLKESCLDSETQEEIPIVSATVYKVDSIDVFFIDPYLCTDIEYDDQADQSIEDINSTYPLPDGEWLIEVLKSVSDGVYFPAEYIYVKAGGPSPSAPVFTDVPADAYYAEAVAWAIEKGITNGTGATTFSPAQTCTRAQIITFLWRAAGSPEPQNVSAFSDVETDAYYAKAAAWAKENGMTSGSTFSPNAPCTRLMAVEFMWKHAGSPNAAAASFSDVSSPAVNWAVEKGVTSGTSAAAFSPDAACTRGQIVTFLYRGFAE